MEESNIGRKGIDRNLSKCINKLNIVDPIVRNSRNFGNVVAIRPFILLKDTPLD